MSCEEAKRLIKNYEGCRLKAYKCPAGIWTIGYGRTTNVRQGDVCTQEQADKWFDEEYLGFENRVKALIKVPVNENQLGALTSFAYNCGTGALKTSTLLRKLNEKNYLGAADEFLKWNKAGSKVLEGLSKRRHAERELFLKPVSGNELPYTVEVTATALNIRAGAGVQHHVLETVKKGTKLTVWAIQTVNGSSWGKNAVGFFNLHYTKRI